ncbi:ABC transporter ATP-binding protein [Brevibacillus brevis]|uniref:ABC transporter ATP-binding protein n=1 Tax=Brevibacillus brevis TaxID=1393 RepID=UPI000D0E51FF|nr:ABC transporter ATP-binding protein [Brevibacillus brevis]PSJ67920.1 peptide ABC transporter ATP-binding protein [Brevibacillus brevis]RED35384.1 peptide/nickel transport system ATP-binding protein [Brevibacillus brevis]GEC87951.1 dipeptide/oligopeptide/nickel ABC transporter ATP-binding protein [Brevibacillus brevis]VEF89505.1 Glutathione import ATP-binding protein GsiA [Brevibacillus brevis]
MLEIKNLQTRFRTDNGEITVLDGVSFQINKGETIGVVGESGCGKSVTSLSIMGLLPRTARITGGEILYNGENLVAFSKDQMRKVRGKEIAMIFQEPMTSLNPVYTIGAQIMELVLNHTSMNKKQAKEHAIQMLKLVGIPRAEEIVDEYPHQLSGGMRQRVMIAMAMSCSPSLLVADEPTTALDVTIQAQILDLMRELQQKSEMTIMLITHDLGVVAEMCDRVVVMYAGQVVEEAEVEKLFATPKHPYTVGLLGSIPDMDTEQEYLFTIGGTVPSPGQMPPGCRFAERCQKATDKCYEQAPPLFDLNDGTKSRCWLYE